MPTILKALFSSATSALGGVWIYLACFAAGAAVAGVSTGIITHKIELAKYEALQLKDAKGVTASLEAQADALRKIGAEQHALDLEVSAGALAEALAQPRIVNHTNTIIREIPTYVTAHSDTTVCVPFGLVRVLDATILAGAKGVVRPGDLALPTGQSDDACSPIKASDLAASVAANYGTDAQNAEQLNALEAWVHNLIEKANQ